MLIPCGQKRIFLTGVPDIFGQPTCCPRVFTMANATINSGKFRNLMPDKLVSVVDLPAPSCAGLPLSLYATRTKTTLGTSIPTLCDLVCLFINMFEHINLDNQGRTLGTRLSRGFEVGPDTSDVVAFQSSQSLDS